MHLHYQLLKTLNMQLVVYLTDNGWVAHSGAGTNPIQVNANSLTYPGYINSGLGKSVTLNGIRLKMIIEHLIVFILVVFMLHLWLM